MRIDGNIDKIKLLRAKDGVYVYKCLYNNKPAVLKSFEKEEYKREIANYRILQKNEIPTINIYAFYDSAILMEDIEFSADWRLGIKDDLSSGQVAKSLASWYFNFHEKGALAPEINSLYCEYDKVTEANIQSLWDKLPEAAETFRYIMSNIKNLREAINSLDYTLTYNDFYWTNFIVRKDNQAAIMFDYNFLGKGFRYADIRNVCSSLSEDAATAFVGEYNRLYESKHGTGRGAKEQFEKQVDGVVSTIFTLIAAFEKDAFPSWAKDERESAINGSLQKAAWDLFKI